MWPAGGADVQWWFDLPWSHDFVRPQRPIDVIRSNFAGWSDSVDLVLATIDRRGSGPSPYPHFRHPIPGTLAAGAVTLLGDAAHTMPPTLAQGTNQALLDTMVLCKAISDLGTRRAAAPTFRRALRRYEKTRRRQVSAVSRVASLQVAHGESVLRPAALISDRLHTWALTQICAVDQSPPDGRGDRSRSRGRELLSRPAHGDQARAVEANRLHAPADTVRVRGDFDAPSRWLWLVKWCVLAVPHYPILILLYLVYPLLTIVAGVAILFTGRYPRPIFDFNVGVLRWSWRVMNYRFPMNSTDKYPPFTLAARPDYPGDLEVDYPRAPDELGRAGEVVAAGAPADTAVLGDGAAAAGAHRDRCGGVVVHRDDSAGDVRSPAGDRSMALPGGGVCIVDV